MASYLYPRDEISNVKDTFSSWDKCMAKDYCKWPVIVAIVVGSLILFSVLFCVARCICCGVELCSCCVSCFTCCGCCKGGGGRRDRDGDRPSKYKDDYTRMPPTPYQGYQPAPSPMAYGAANPHTPQFATFDDPSTKRLINEDSLPHMPSWDTASTRRVEDKSAPPESKNGDLEMGRMEPQPDRMRGGYNGVPNAVSPLQAQQQPDYFHDTGMNHAYNPDLGAQKMSGPNDRDNFQPIPLSPPPTYRSNSTAPSIASDHLLGGAPSPLHHDYNRVQPQRQPSYQSSYAPSSTRYEPSRSDHGSDVTRLSMPMPYNPGPQALANPPYPASEASPYENRPPSFLQPGRRPVGGSTREV